MKSMMSSRYITRVNAERAAEWHVGAPEWCLLEWAGALCGEAGELANVCKKIRRAEQGINPESKGGNEITRELMESLGEEIADTFLYLNILCGKAGINMYGVIAEKFNKVSIRDGRPQRLVDYPGPKL